MNGTSEWVSLGHPDKTADYISEYILDRYIEKDPETRYAVEVQIKDNHVCLGGEITSKADFNNEQLADFVHNAVSEIGYTHGYALQWNGQCTDADALTCDFHIGRQSPDIAKGVDKGGWGDQGIFWGMATADKDCNYMPRDAFLARRIGQELYRQRIGGIDIKTQVTLEPSGDPKSITLAVPMHIDGGSAMSEAVRIARMITMDVMGQTCPVYINGTGQYVTHGSVGDCGTTGRKLAVDFYGGNCEIGGGSPWTKDGTKADLTLNLYARKLALEWAKEYRQDVKVMLYCRIGSPEIGVRIFGKHNLTIHSEEGTKTTDELKAMFRLDTPCFTEICSTGLPYWVK